MKDDLRKSGIGIIGDVPWGMHLCQLYQSKEDLIGILVPYFKKGLENNEFCMWVCCDPLRAEEARASLSKRLKNLDNYIKKGQIEIVDYSRQQTEREDSGFTKMKQFWIDKERQALERGFEGLRLAGNTYWLEKREWKDFKQYETEVDDIIRNHKMLAICPYSIDKCGAPEIIDVIGSHKSALIKREGRWEIIESSGRKKAEEVLQRTKQQMEFILGATKTGLDIIDSDFNIVYIDSEWQKVYGDPTGKKCYEYFMGNNAVCPNCGIVKALKTKKPVVSEEVLIKEGNRPIQVTTIPFKDEKGNWLVAEVNVDITERKKAEEALHFTRFALDNAVEAMVCLSQDARYIDANDTFCRVVGYSREELLSMTAHDIDPNYSAKIWPEFWKKLKQSGSLTFESCHRTKDGKVFPVEVTVTFFEYKGKEYHCGFARDITERKKAEEELCSSEEKFSKAFNLSPSAVFITTLKEGRFIEINKTGLDMFGYKPDEIVGRTVKELGLWADPNDRATLIGRLQKEGIVRNMEASFHRKSGEVFPAIISVDVVDIAGQQFLLSTCTDITERKKAEEALKKAYSELEEEKKLLTNKNIAFQEVIKEIEIEKNELKDEVIVNVNEIILPILKRIRLKGGAPRKYLGLLEKSLETLTSSFGRRLIEKTLKLTPKETEVCNMVKSGLTTKEISGLLNTSSQTIDKHRKNIRKKFGLSNKSTNLTSFLQSL